jgi:predicted nucleic acid-binding protein
VLLLDNSAWARLLGPEVPAQRAEEIAALNDRGELAVSLPFLLEAGYSARSGADRAQTMRRLTHLPLVEVDHEVELLALDAQRELAEVGHHRLPIADIVIAACAHTAGAGVLHYDADYDLIRRHTSLLFESAWLAPRGSLGM